MKNVDFSTILASKKLHIAKTSELEKEAQETKTRTTAR